jgi:hypothetical protein
VRRRVHDAQFPNSLEFRTIDPQHLREPSAPVELDRASKAVEQLPAHGDGSLGRLDSVGDVNSIHFNDRRRSSGFRRVQKPLLRKVLFNDIPQDRRVRS